MKQNLAVRIKTAQWKVALTINDPRSWIITELCSELNTFKRLMRHTPKRISTLINTEHWQKEIHRAEKWIRSMASRNSRPKRAVLGIVGQLSHDLFGTVTEEELREVASRVNENRQSLQKVVHFNNKLLSVINVTFEEMNRNRLTINEIINSTHYIKDQIIQIVSDANLRVHALRTYNDITEKMTLVWRHIQELQRIVDEYNDIRHALEQGRLDEYVLPSTILKDILSRSDFSSAQMVTPMEWYYTNCRVLPIWGHDYLAFIVHLPLVDPRPYRGFQVETYPIPLENSTNTAKVQASGLVAVGPAGRLLDLGQCVGQDPIVCDPAPIRREGTSAYTCAQALIMQEIRIAKKCPVLIESRPEGLLLTTQPNHVILVTHGEDVVERCKERVQRTSLEAGTYQIEWSGDCFITTLYWTLPGVVTREVNRTLSIGWSSWEVPQFMLPKLIADLNTTLEIPEQLSTPMTISLLPLTPPKPFTALPSHSHNYLYLILLALVIPIIAIAVGVYYVYNKYYVNKVGKRKGEEVPGTKVGEIELEKNRSCESLTYRLPLPGANKP